MADKKEPEDQRHVDREEELARQKKVTDALEKHELAERAAAEKLLKDQQQYEATGIRVVEGKP